jgi:hypothetical protein
MHRRVGVVHGHALLGEQLRGGAFAHRHRAGETDHEHSRGQQLFAAQPA